MNKPHIYREAGRWRVTTQREQPLPSMFAPNKVLKAAVNWASKRNARVPARQGRGRAPEALLA